MSVNFDKFNILCNFLALVLNSCYVVCFFEMSLVRACFFFLSISLTHTNTFLYQCSFVFDKVTSFVSSNDPTCQPKKQKPFSTTKKHGVNTRTSLCSVWSPACPGSTRVSSCRSGKSVGAKVIELPAASLDDLWATADAKRRVLPPPRPRQHTLHLRMLEATPLPLILQLLVDIGGAGIVNHLRPKAISTNL